MYQAGPRKSHTSSFVCARNRRKLDYRVTVPPVIPSESILPFLSSRRCLREILRRLGDCYSRTSERNDARTICADSGKLLSSLIHTGRFRGRFSVRREECKKWKQKKKKKTENDFNQFIIARTITSDQTIICKIIRRFLFQLVGENKNY